MTRRIHWRAADSAVPLNEPDIRERVMIRGREVLMRRPWRSCASGATFEAPPSMPPRKRGTPRLTALELHVLEAATSTHTRRSSGGIGRLSIYRAVAGRPDPTMAQAEAIDDALLRLERLRLIVATPINDRTTLYGPADQTEVT